MVFTSFAFLFAFLPVLLLVYYAVPGRFRNLCLLVFSYAFYGWWRADFVLLLLTCSIVDYTTGRLIGESTRPRAKKAWLLISLTFNLGALSFFKYANFGVENLNALLASAGMRTFHWTAIVLPVGISFYTFQSMSYTIDVYRGEVSATKNPLTFATFVALFPQLVAGPIVRYRDIGSALRERQHSLDLFARGALVFIIGFNKKVLLANNFGLVADEAFVQNAAGMSSAWLGLLAYTFQIYFDFSGYSEMALGLGRMFGFEFPRNFDAPYRSASITEFWRRWHISLSTWIRDYLYVSLGGNRGTPASTYRNLAVSMLLCGLWHGANWTFIAWGAFHAALLIGERLNGRRALYSGLPHALRVACTFFLVMLGWAVFRSPNIGQFGGFVTRLFDVRQPGFAPGTYWAAQPTFALVCLVAFAILFRGKDALELADRRSLPTIAFQFAGFALAMGELLSQGFNPFLYFQF